MAIPDISDRWLWLGFGVFFVLAARGLRYAINDTVRLIELPPDEGNSKEQKDHPEDAITLTSLRTLASSPNPNIRNAAVSLIITRFASLPSAAEMVTSDLDSSNPQVQRQARQAVEYLKEWDAELAQSNPFRAGNASPHVDLDYRQWERTLEEELFDPTRRRDRDVLSPLSQLEALTGGETGGEMMDRLHREYLMGSDRTVVERPVTVGQEEAERRRGRREVAVIHEGPGRINEEDIFRPR